MYKKDYDGVLIATLNGSSACCINGLWHACDWFYNGTRQNLDNSHELPESAIEEARQTYT